MLSAIDSRTCLVRSLAVAVTDHIANLSNCRRVALYHGEMTKRVDFYHASISFDKRMQSEKREDAYFLRLR